MILLLTEYSDKLLNICDQINRQWRRKCLFISLFAMFFFLLVISIIIALSLYNKVDQLMNNLTLLILNINLLLILFIPNIIDDTQQKLKWLRRYAKTLSINLEKIIRVSSQAEEHILRSVLHKIELDLRLADAETVLQHYTAMAKK